MISIVTTAFNEEEAIPSLCRAIHSVMSDLGKPWELLIIDDGSTDGTWLAIRDASSANPRLRAFRLRKNQGKAFALRVAFAEARGNVIVTMDADLQDDPKDVPGLLSQMETGYDMVVGWRWQRADVWLKRLYSGIFNAVLRRLTGLRIHDHNCGLKVLTSEAAKGMALYGDFHRYMTLIAFSEGFKVGECKTHHEPRQFGKSKYNFTRLFTAPMDLFSLLILLRYQHRPLRLLGSIGAAIAFVGGGLLSYLAILWFAGHPIGHRPLLIYATVLSITGVQLITLGVVAELIVWNAEGSSRQPPEAAICDRISNDTVR